MTIINAGVQMTMLKSSCIVADTTDQRAENWLWPYHIGTAGRFLPSTSIPRPSVHLLRWPWRCSKFHCHKTDLINKRQNNIGRMGEVHEYGDIGRRERERERESPMSYGRWKLSGCIYTGVQRAFRHIFKKS
jgi:hypothetical protein